MDEREAFFKQHQDELFKTVRAMQGRVGVLLIKMSKTFEVSKDGTLKYSQKNLKILSAMLKLLSSSLDNSKGAVAKKIFANIKTLFDLNTDYFKAVETDKIGSTMESRALKSVLLSLGTSESGTILKGGYMDTLTSSQSIAKQLTAVVVKSLKEGLTKDEFAKDFNTVMTGGAKLGIIERHYFTKAFTLYQKFDRAIQAEYRDELGLRYAIYSGTLKNNTRPFCKARVNKVYSEDEIKKWNGQNWNGKIENGDVVIDAGGYNCRHHFSWISKEMALYLAPLRGGLNTYN